MKHLVKNRGVGHLFRIDAIYVCAFVSLVKVIFSYDTFYLKKNLLSISGIKVDDNVTFVSGIRGDGTCSSNFFIEGSQNFADEKELFDGDGLRDIIKVNYFTSLSIKKERQESKTVEGFERKKVFMFVILEV